MTRKPWMIGDMICKNPHRLIGVLNVLRSSPFNGNVNDDMKRNAFVKLLHENNVVHYKGVTKGKCMKFEGRKWILALSRFGFVTPLLSSSKKMIGKIDPLLLDILEGDNDLCDLPGRPFEITPSGTRFRESETNIDEQENLLRAIMGYRLIINDEKNQHPIHKNRNLDANDLEIRFNMNFSPLRFVLDILYELNSRNQDSTLSRSEFAFFVQTSDSSYDINKVVDKILGYRKKSLKLEENGKQKNEYEKNTFEHITREIHKDSKEGEKKFRLYAPTDCTFLHLKSTGLFCSAPNGGIEISKSHAVLADMIRSEKPECMDFKTYMRSLMTKPRLPIDDAEKAKKVIRHLQKMYLNEKDTNSHSKDHQKLLSSDIKVAMRTYQEGIREIKEIEYAKEQYKNIKEITSILLDLSKKNPSKKVVIKNGPAVTLEWAIWLAFLAMGGNPINSLHEKKKARRFEIDHECNPVSHAPGNGPDMAFEFEDFIVVAEVTRIITSKQDRAESEPVRRHVAWYIDESKGDKDVYCLFVAPEIDNNMAHSFLGSVWYPHGKDEEMILNIVPVDLKALVTFLRTQVKSGRIGNNKGILAIEDLVLLMSSCRVNAKMEKTRAPEWKRSISKLFSNY